MKSVSVEDIFAYLLMLDDAEEDCAHKVAEAYARGDTVAAERAEEHWHIAAERHSTMKNLVRTLKITGYGEYWYKHSKYSKEA